MGGGWLLHGRECRRNIENRLQFICAAVVVTLHSTVLHIMVLRYFGGAGWQPPNGTQASEALQHCAASLSAPMPTAPSAQRVCVGAARVVASLSVAAPDAVEVELSLPLGLKLRQRPPTDSRQQGFVEVAEVTPGSSGARQPWPTPRWP